MLVVEVGFKLDKDIKYYENMAKEGMNRRVDIFKTKEKVSKLEKDLETKTKKLEKEVKQIENFHNYLLKILIFLLGLY